MLHLPKSTCKIYCHHYFEQRVACRLTRNKEPFLAHRYSCRRKKMCPMKGKGGFICISNKGLFHPLWKERAAVCRERERHNSCSCKWPIKKKFLFLYIDTHAQSIHTRGGNRPCVSHVEIGRVFAVWIKKSLAHLVFVPNIANIYNLVIAFIPHSLRSQQF